MASLDININIANAARVSKKVATSLEKDISTNLDKAFDKSTKKFHQEAVDPKKLEKAFKKLKDFAEKHSATLNTVKSLSAKMHEEAAANAVSNWKFTGMKITKHLGGAAKKVKDRWKDFTGKIKENFKESMKDAWRSVKDSMKKILSFGAAIGGITALIIGVKTAFFDTSKQTEEAARAAYDWGDNVNDAARGATSLIAGLGPATLMGAEGVGKLANAFYGVGLSTEQIGAMIPTFDTLSAIGTDFVDLGISEQFMSMSHFAGVSTEELEGVAGAFTGIHNSTVRNKLLSTVTQNFRFMGTGGVSAMKKAATSAGVLSKALQGIGVTSDEITSLMEQFSKIDIYEEGNIGQTLMAFGASMDEIRSLQMGDMLGALPTLTKMAQEFGAELSDPDIGRQRMRDLGISEEMATAIIQMHQNQDKFVSGLKKARAEQEKQNAAAAMHDRLMGGFHRQIEKIKGVWSSLTMIIGSALKPVLEALADIVESILQKFIGKDGLQKAIEEKVKPKMEALAEGIKNTVAKIGEIFTKVKEWWDGLPPGIKTLVKLTGVGAAITIGGIVAFAKKGPQIAHTLAMIAHTKALLGTGGKGLLKKIPGVGALGKALTKMKTFFTKPLSLKGMFKGFTGLFKRGGKIAKIFGSFTRIGGAVTKIFTKAIAPIMAGVEWIGGTFKSITDLSNKFDFTSIGDILFGSLMAAGEGAVSGLLALFVDFPAWIIGWFDKDLAQQIKNFTGEIRGWMNELVTEAYAAWQQLDFWGLFGDIWRDTKLVFSGWGVAMSEWWAGLDIQGWINETLWKPIADGFTKITEWWDQFDLVAAIRSILPSWLGGSTAEAATEGAGGTETAPQMNALNEAASATRQAAEQQATATEATVAATQAQERTSRSMATVAENLANITHYQKGGLVPGGATSKQLAVVHGGEMVVPSSMWKKMAEGIGITVSTTPTGARFVGETGEEISTQDFMQTLVSGITDVIGRGGMEGFADAVAKRESGSDAGAVNTLGYMGYYQFGAPALADLGVLSAVPPSSMSPAQYGKGKRGPNIHWGAFTHPELWTGKGGWKNYIDFLADPEGQTTLFTTEWLPKLWKRIGASVKAKVGTKVDNVLISKSGLLGGAHLQGAGGVNKWVRAGGGTMADAYGTDIKEYISLFGGYKIPEFQRGGKLLAAMHGGERVLTEEQDRMFAGMAKELAASSMIVDELRMLRGEIREMKNELREIKETNKNMEKDSKDMLIHAKRPGRKSTEVDLFAG